jgi:hypothetical protein
MITLTARGNMGPAMLALAQPKQAFVDALMSLGTDDFVRAAELAGYANANRESLKSTAHRLIHDDRIQVAIKEETRRRLTGLLPLAISRVRDVLTDPLQAGGVTLKAAETVMNRGGLPAVTEQKIEVTRAETPLQQVDRIARLAQQLGLDPKTLLGQYGVNTDEQKVIEVEYTEVTSDDGRGGLEDLL